ncbi:PepSY domain-containing protein [Shewanella sp. C32]|uniref:PepSY domain-containing protein n=1 Tax=Shewanella electrica TaxID=515560 RepID=A0ABT2FIK0_9GAMM|nr:PepSY-associated TM helix domain-containing protein [Shewanella electrica]MCH1924257.1 PepSY domain-containing protein [Shewanella electrica]MCS4556160.1 PepSY domain-containing protein [Shewanella electrica]
MKFDKQRSFRKSMTWVHTWTGLPVGWLLFAIFVTGTLSFYRLEITQWMQPETQQATIYDQGQGLTHATALLEEYGADAEQWTIGFPTARTPLYQVRWRVPEPEQGEAREGKPGSHNAAAKSEQQHSTAAPATDSAGKLKPQEGYRGMKYFMMDPATGQVITPRDTAGGEFLYRFHFQLYGMHWAIGRTLVVIATFFMFVAIITGVIIHRNIFKDFFSFRPRKGQRSWLDAHAATSVIALPFHLILTFSGLLFLAGQLVPMVAGAAYNGDPRGFLRDYRGGGNIEQPAPNPNNARLYDINAIAADALQRAPEGIDSINIKRPGKADAEISVTTLAPSLFGGKASLDDLRYDGVTGKFLPKEEPEHSAAETIWKFMLTTHMGLFATPITRALLFLSGVFGSVMIASGLVMWLVAREKDRQKLGYMPKGHRLVERLNVAAIAGLMCAVAGFFWANRLVPATQAERGEWEINGFFIVWGICLLHAIFRPHLHAWREQLLLAALGLMSLPLLNGLSGGNFIWQNLQQGQFASVGFDLTALALGLGLLFAARQVQLKIQAAKTLASPAEPKPRFNKRQADSLQEQ